MTEINGSLGLVATVGGKPIAAVMTMVADGRISAIHLVASPDKLRGLATGRILSL
jgi:RNA polymerase sigma-70 factor (ECF subfamily)